MLKQEQESTTPLTIAAIVVSTLLVGVPFFRLIDRYAVNLLFWDQWDAYRPLFEERSLWAVFSQQHGPPRLGLGLVASKIVADLSAWNGRAESFLVGALIVVAMCLALWLKARLFGSLRFVDALLPPMFLTMMHFESLVIVPLPAHSAMPLVLVMLIALAWTIRSLPARYFTIALLDFLLVFTGFGLFMGLVTPALLLCDIVQRLLRGTGQWRWPAGSLVSSVLALFAFTIGYQIDPATGAVNEAAQRPLDVLWFIGLMLSRYLGLPYGLVPAVATLVGSATLAMMIAILVYHARRILVHGITDRSTSVAISALIAFTLLFGAVTALGRMGPNVVAASQSSRYALLIVPGFVGVYLHLLTVRPLLPRALLLAVLAALMLPWPLTGPDVYAMRAFARGKQTWKRCYVVVQNARECEQLTHFLVHPTPDALAERLAYLQAHRLNLFAESAK